MSVLVGWACAALIIAFVVSWIRTFWAPEKNERPQYEPRPYRTPKPIPADRVTVDNWYARRRRGSVPDVPRKKHVP